MGTGEMYHRVEMSIPSITAFLNVVFPELKRNHDFYPIFILGIVTVTFVCEKFQFFGFVVKYMCFLLVPQGDNNIFELSN